jgi:hypothetical protein
MADVRLIRLKFKDILWLDGKDGRKKNPRKEDMAAVEKLAGRIKEDPTFYDNRPSLVSFSGGKYYGYGGHKRALAATKVLKWPDIPCNVENDVPQPIMDKRAILDNLHDGEWDKDELLNFGFDTEELYDLGIPEFTFDFGADENEDGTGTPDNSKYSGDSEKEQPSEARPIKGNLADRFGLPPFSVLNAREGVWQDRKRQWLALGIKSEIGRGGAMTYKDHDWMKAKGI